MDAHAEGANAILALQARAEVMKSSGAAEDRIVGLLIVAILIGALGATAITALATPSNTTSWTTAEIALYGILGTMVCIGFVILIVRYAMGHNE